MHWLVSFPHPRRWVLSLHPPLAGRKGAVRFREKWESWLIPRPGLEPPAAPPRAFLVDCYCPPLRK